CIVDVRPAVLTLAPGGEAGVPHPPAPTGLAIPEPVELLALRQEPVDQIHVGLDDLYEIISTHVEVAGPLQRRLVDVVSARAVRELGLDRSVDLVVVVGRLRALRTSLPGCSREVGPHAAHRAAPGSASHSRAWMAPMKTGFPFGVVTTDCAPTPATIGLPSTTSYSSIHSAEDRPILALASTRFRMLQARSKSAFITQEPTW